MSHGWVLGTETCCSNAHIPATAFAGAQRRLLQHAPERASSRTAVPAIPQWSHRWVIGTGWETWCLEEGTQLWQGLRVKASLGNWLPACLCVHVGQEGFRSFHNALAAGRAGLCLKGLGGSNPVCNLGNTGCGQAEVPQADTAPLPQ